VVGISDSSKIFLPQIYADERRYLIFCPRINAKYMNQEEFKSSRLLFAFLRVHSRPKSLDLRSSAQICG